MSTILITGANKGLGYETARQLVGNGHNVYIGARDEKRGIAAAQELGCHFVHLDVSDDGSVQRAAEQMKRAENFWTFSSTMQGSRAGWTRPPR